MLDKLSGYLSKIGLVAQDNEKDKLKPMELISDLREIVSTPRTKRGIIRLVLFILGLILGTLLLTFIMLQFAPAISRFSDYGYLGIFLITMISSFTVILPLPGIILWLSFVVSMQLNLAISAVVASIGGSLGEITAYYVGYAGKAVIAPKDSKMYAAAEKWMKRHGELTIFLFAFFPFLIMDIVGIVSGVIRYPVKKFLLFVWLGRLPRSFIELYVYYYFQRTLVDYILPHLPDWLTWVA